MRVLATKHFFDADLQYMRERLDPRIELIFPAAYTAEAISAIADSTIEALLGEYMTAELLDKAVNLKLIQIPWTGVDRLNFDLLRRYTIPVCNSHSNAPMVAEYAISLLLAAMKQIPLHDRALRQGDWKRPRRDDPEAFVPPVLLAGSTIGIVGFGTIGRAIAELLKGFAVRLLAIDARHYDTPPPPLTAIYPSEALPQVLPEADAILLALPLTPQTTGIFDAALFACLKPSAYLVNVSRGEVLNETALFEALSNHKIAGAAIDTWYNYPSAAQPQVFPSATYPFHTLDNLILSPHRAGFAKDRLPHLDDAIENLNRLVRGEPLHNLVNLEYGY